MMSKLSLKDIFELARQMKQAKSEYEAAFRDRRRLDWLQLHCVEVYGPSENPKEGANCIFTVGCACAEDPPCEHPIHTDLRHAIDVAIEMEEEN